MKNKRWLSILLCIAMIISMIPGLTLTASAAVQRSVSTMDELKSALESSQSLDILVTKDLYLETKSNLGTWCTTRGEKAIDLNGHSIELKNSRLETSGNKELMFCVPSGSTVTVRDRTTDKKGKIFHNGYIDGFGTAVIRNVFKIEEGGTLNMESGTITTGRYESVWETMLARRVTKHTWGTGIIVDGGIFNMYGGTVEGSGRLYSTVYFVDCSGIESTSEESLINIFNGKVFAANGAPALKGTANGSWIVQNGQLVTSGTDNTYINGGGPVKKDAAPTGLQSFMMSGSSRSWSIISKYNNSGSILASTDVTVQCTALLPVIVSCTTTADANKVQLKAGDSVPLYVTAAGGTGPYIYDWQVLRPGSSSWSTLGNYSQRKSYRIGSNLSIENGAQLRCVVTDANGRTATTVPVTLNVIRPAITSIDEISLTVAEPRVGKAPASQAVSNTTGVITGSVDWYRKTGSTYQEMKTSETFRAGEIYKVQIFMHSADPDVYDIGRKGLSEKEGLLINGKTVTEHSLNHEDAVDLSLSLEFPILNPFTDVKTSAYYANPVFWAVNQGITSGMSDTTFCPDLNCTRGQVVTFLWRAAGKPEPTKTTNPFVDVKSSEYYYKPILWAVENGITSGMSANTFEPNGACTRGQVVTFLWRAAGKPEPKKTTNPFTDVKSSAYYYKAVLWAVESGITSGMSANTFEPDSVCTRGQVVTFLYRQYNRL